MKKLTNFLKRFFTKNKPLKYLDLDCSEKEMFEESVVRFVEIENKDIVYIPINCSKSELAQLLNLKEVVENETQTQLLEWLNNQKN